MTQSEELKRRRARIDARRREAHPWRKLYHTRGWKALRVQRLTEEPLCRSCLARGKVIGATTVDHITKHEGNEDLFYDYENTQSLCTTCHNSAKQSEERLGYSKEVGVDGWPTDPRHPANVEAHAAELRAWSKGFDDG